MHTIALSSNSQAQSIPEFLHHFSIRRPPHLRHLLPHHHNDVKPLRSRRGLTINVITKTHEKGGNEGGESSSNEVVLKGNGILYTYG